jgi:hypothetical protein
VRIQLLALDGNPVVHWGIDLSGLDMLIVPACEPNGERGRAGIYIQVDGKITCKRCKKLVKGEANNG